MTKLTLSDKAQKAERVIRETFWNDGQNRVIEREDGSFAPYWEAIVETKISEFPPVWEVLRLGRRQGILIPWYHGFIRDNEDGSQTETKVSLASLT